MTFINTTDCKCWDHRERLRNVLHLASVPATIPLQHLSSPSGGAWRRSPFSVALSFQYVEFEVLVGYPRVNIQ